MEDGFESGNFGVITDPDYRFQLYLSWRSLIKRGENPDPKEFTEGHNIPFESLGEIVREFTSYDPTGERWG